MKSFLVLVFFTIILSIYSQQNLNDELKTASQITNSTERLNAYDKILEKYDIRTNSESTSTGEWSFGVKTDPITDSKIITFMLRAISGSGIYGDPIYLVIRWDKGEVEKHHFI
ncbi:MAG: hypothetical protein LBK00_02540 [Treponema sp.]|jgi:hypothetical protein|nr:hypothetical protein [Treponema sp.]